LMFQGCLFDDETSQKESSPGKNVTFHMSPRNLVGLDSIAKLISSSED